MRGARAALLAALLAAPLFLLLPLLAAAAGARAQGAMDEAPRPPLVAELSQHRIEITTAFTGASLLVFGSTERAIGGEGGDEVLVAVWGPELPMVVRRKVRFLGLWVNGPAATFRNVPGYYAIAGTRPAWQLLPEPERQARRLGLDALPLRATGAQGPGFRAALLELKQAARLWVEDGVEVEVAGGRLFHARLPLPATVSTGDYRVEVLLIRDEREVARQELFFRVGRTGSAAQIASVAREAPLVYGLGCIALAAAAGWLGSVLFRRA